MPGSIAGCVTGTVRNTPHAFGIEGVGCLTEKKTRSQGRPADPRRETRTEPLKAILHQSPRQFGQARSTWTLDLLADVAFERKLTPRRLSHEVIRRAVKRLGHGWKRAKTWITSPDPAYARKKKPATG